MHLSVSCRHPNVVSFRGVCPLPPCVVTEYCSRGSLADVFRTARQQRNVATRLDWRRRLSMVTTRRWLLVHCVINTCSLFVLQTADQDSELFLLFAAQMLDTANGMLYLHRYQNCGQFGIMQFWVATNAPHGPPLSTDLLPTYHAAMTRL